jgi:hypothetical protein
MIVEWGRGCPNCAKLSTKSYATKATITAQPLGAFTRFLDSACACRTTPNDYLIVHAVPG